MEIALNRQEDGTIKLKVTIPWSKVKKSYDKFFEKALSKVEVDGFRKGKAPKKLAETRIDKQKIYQELIKEIIPKFYLEAVYKEGLRPITAPKIELLKAKEGEDWQFKAILCEKPKVELGDYKKAIRELKIKKETKIWLPNQTSKIKNQKVTLDDILNAVLKVTKIKIPRLLLEEEVNRNLADLLDQIRLLGLTVEQYLKAKGKTAEELKEEYRQKAEKAFILEFVLEKIADEEKIVISEKEIDEFISKEKDKEVQEKLRNQKYFLAPILRRQKTLEALIKS